MEMINAPFLSVVIGLRSPLSAIPCANVPGKCLLRKSAALEPKQLDSGRKHFDPIMRSTYVPVADGAGRMTDRGLAPLTTRWPCLLFWEQDLLLVVWCYPFSICLWTLFPHSLGGTCSQSHHTSYRQKLNAALHSAKQTILIHSIIHSLVYSSVEFSGTFVFNRCYIIL